MNLDLLIETIRRFKADNSLTTSQTQRALRLSKTQWCELMGEEFIAKRPWQYGSPARAPILPSPLSCDKLMDIVKKVGLEIRFVPKAVAEV